MSAAVVSATVAGIAVVVSGVMQYLTLQRAKDDTERMLAASQRTARVTALSSSTTIWEQGLREDLAEFATLTYEVESAFDWAMDHKESWPGEHMPKVTHVEVLFNRIMLRLDRDAPAQQRVADTLEAMRDDKKVLWTTRRDALVAAGLEAFRAKWAEVLDGQPLAPP